VDPSVNSSLRKVLFDSSRIQSAVQRIASEVVAWRGDTPGLDLVCVLEGARPFTRDLVRDLRDLRPRLAIRVHEVVVKGTDGTRLLEERALSIGGLVAQGLRGRDLLLVDDLVDSGKTLAVLKEVLMKAGAQEVRTAVLVRKYGEESGPVDLCGFDLRLDRGAMARQGIKDYWLYGYGMDEDGKSRDLDHIGWLEVR
jgi:hypoxanthine phosphoribosyltransferase